MPIDQMKQNARNTNVKGSLKYALIENYLIEPTSKIRVFSLFSISTIHIWKPHQRKPYQSWNKQKFILTHIEAKKTDYK